MKTFIIYNRIFTLLGFCFVMVILGCNKEALVPQEQGSALAKAGGTTKISGATQISGVSFLATADECDYVTAGATFSIKLTGDLEGCWYAFVDAYDCSPSGTYRESGREHFVGTYKGGAGSFWTSYKFEGKYEGCGADGAPFGAEIFGRCQHPIVAGSGDGVFEGVTGRLDFKDDIAAGNFPYRGHLGF